MVQACSIFDPLIGLMAYLQRHWFITKYILQNTYRLLHTCTNSHTPANELTYTDKPKFQVYIH